LFLRAIQVVTFYQKKNKSVMIKMAQDDLPGVTDLKLNKLAVSSIDLNFKENKKCIKV